MSEEQQEDRTASRAPSEGHSGDSLVEAIPGLARIYAQAWLRTAEWAVESSLRAGSQVMRAAVSGDSPAGLFDQAGADLREYARRLVGIVDPEYAARGGESDPVDQRSNGEDSSTEALRERGTELLRRSADVRYEEDTHPAYARILEQLTPDEGRILRLLALEGPQPAVDVRAGWLPFHIGSELVALGLSMIGEEAGCRHVDRVQPYLNNLNRLGLVWFAHEPVEDRHRYHVLEAQPNVTEAMHKAGRAGSTVRRSVHLTPFGKDFCEVCLPVDTAELEALPGDGRPERKSPGEETSRATEEQLATAGGEGVDQA
jgi:hypothetical protein